MQLICPHVSPDLPSKQIPVKAAATPLQQAAQINASRDLMHTDKTFEKYRPDSLSRSAARNENPTKTYADAAIAVLACLALPAVAISTLFLSSMSFSSTQLLACVLIAFAMASFDYLTMTPVEMDAVHQAQCMEFSPYLAQPEHWPITEESTIAFYTEASK